MVLEEVDFNIDDVFERTYDNLWAWRPKERELNLESRSMKMFPGF